MHINSTEWDLIIISLLVCISIIVGLCTWKQAKNHYGSPLEFNHAHYSINSLRFSLTWGASLIREYLNKQGHQLEAQHWYIFKWCKMLIWRPIILQSIAQGSQHLPQWHFLREKGCLFQQCFSGCKYFCYEILFKRMHLPNIIRWQPKNKLITCNVKKHIEHVFQ